MAAVAAGWRRAPPFNPRTKDMDRETSTSVLHPHFKCRLERLMGELNGGFVRGIIPCRFEIFETYRNPIRQQSLFELGHTHARPWQSGHQYGLAADIVPLTAEDRWTWDPPAGGWDALRTTAISVGLDAPIPWDKAHVQHPVLLAAVRQALGW